MSASEVKNVAKQGLTRQIRDYIDHAQAEGIEFHLYVPGPETPLSKPLDNAIKAGLIQLKWIE